MRCVCVRRSRNDFSRSRNLPLISFQSAQRFATTIVAPCSILGAHKHTHVSISQYQALSVQLLGFIGPICAFMISAPRKALIRDLFCVLELDANRFQRNYRQSTKTTTNKVTFDSFLAFLSSPEATEIASVYLSLSFFPRSFG